tara:strand:+ start:998 stop:1891 length:894 start_codon:yes stop_codon:yes gene_type:complete
MVVLGLVALLTAIAIPGLARLGAFSRDEFRRTVQDVSGLLRAAQIYSTTYHVNTAVVYNLDNWSNDEATAVDIFPGSNPATENPADPAFAPVLPIVDSISGNLVRQFESASLMYQLPSSMGALSGHYVPIPGEKGDFNEFPQGMAILLMNPEEPNTDAPPVPQPIYWNQLRSNFRLTDTIPMTTVADEMGISRVSVALGVPSGLEGVDFATFASTPTNFTTETFGAHVFKPSGRLGVNSNNERFTIYIAPVASRIAEERLIIPELDTHFDAGGLPNMLYRKIHIFKSTGRTEIPKNF